MDVSKVPPADVPAARTGTATAAAAQQGSASAADITPPVDRADIRPLEISGALQILLAEVRTALDLTLDATVTQSPIEAARDLVNVFLQVLPEDAGDAPAWTAALGGLESGMQTSIERAIGVVEAWREVPVAVVDAVKQTQALFLAALSDEPRNPLWLRPEWMSLGPGMQRFRRRRRNARRRLTDPDYPMTSLDEDEELRR
jgi:hypothetical protein